MTVIGTDLDRSDGAAKVRGRAVYGVDHAETGMLEGAVLRSPAAAGRITRIDVTAASAMPGVVAVRTGADQPDTTAGWVMKDQRLLATDSVRYEGEAVALVVAETRRQALAAVRAIELEIEEIDPLDLEHVMEPDARLVHPDWEAFEPAMGPDYPRHGNVAAEMRAEPDGIDEIFASAAHVVEDRVVSDRQYQAYIEPKAAVASYDGGRVTIHSSTQYPFNVRDRVAQFLGMRPSQIRVLGKTIGGGFGGKLDASIEPFAAFMAVETNRTVRFCNERTEDLLTATSRENAIVTIRTAVDADGRLLARDLVADLDNGAHSGEMPWLASLPLHSASAVYKVDGPTRVVARLWYTNTAPTGAYRGVGGNYLYAALEGHMDHIADTIGVDRREFRLRHLWEDGHTNLNGQVFEDAGILREAFDALETVAPWSEVNAAKSPMQGVGIAASVWLTNPMPGQATVKVNEDGSVNVVTGATENGSGAVTLGITQIVAEELGVDPAEVIISLPDTDSSGYDSGSQGSRTTAIVGRAAKDATAEVRRQLCDVAAGLLEANPDDIEIVAGQVTVKGTPAKSLGLADVATAATWTRGPIAATSSYTTPPPDFNPGCASGLLFPVFPTPTYHVHMAVVEVDPVTGNVKVLRYVVVQEVGRVISPSGIRGQVQGGISQGIGHALYESLRIGADCRYVERTFETYGLPLAVDVPDVELVTLEHPDDAGPFGAKGAAEPAIVLAPAAILNAISDAIGARVSNIPTRPEDVLEAMAAAR